jgi:O-succinylbenzoic acid--CoA ligase
MHTYPFANITCNHRSIAIDDIVRSVALSNDAFEASLFTFIRQWLNGTDEFKLTTSGSTGVPKAITLPRQRMISSALMTSRVLNLKKGDRALLCLNPEFIAGKMMIVRSLEAGMSLVAVSPSSHPMKQVDGSIDFAAMVPLQVHDMLHEDPSAFNRLGRLIIGGGAIDAQDIQLLGSVPTQCFATYGMTETVSHVALRQLNGEGASRYYKAMPGVRFSLDQRSCLVIEWDALGDPVITNDLVELLGDDAFTWLGRWDNVINSGGIKILPERLEASISELMQQAGHHVRFFLTSVPDARLGSKLVMVLEDPYMETNHNELRTLLKVSLQSHEIPKEIISCRRFQETETGKINRNSSLELAIRGNGSTY